MMSYFIRVIIALLLVSADWIQGITGRSFMRKTKWCCFSCSKTFEVYHWSQPKCIHISYKAKSNWYV